MQYIRRNHIGVHQQELAKRARQQEKKERKNICFKHQLNINFNFNPNFNIPKIKTLIF
jgi:hypothetical protein